MPRHQIASAALALTALALTACGDDEPSAAATSTTVAAKSTPATTLVPPYVLNKDGRQIVALVVTEDSQELTAIYREIAQKAYDTYEEGGYSLYLDCAFGNDPAKAANRLATARIAVGKLGAVQFGLAPNTASFEQNPGRRCVENPTPTPTIDKNAPLNEENVLARCKSRVEEQYVASQLPVTLIDPKVTEGTDGTWRVKGKVQGKRGDISDSAIIDFTCEVSTTTSSAKLAYPGR